MSQFRPRRDPRALKPETPLDINSVWASGHADDHTLKPPKANDPAQVPFTRLLHHLDYLDNLREAMPIDSGLVELIQRKMTALNGTLTRKCITLNLVKSDADVFTVELWIIPVYLDGVLIHYLFAADDQNIALIRENRNPIRPETYEFSSF
jgi:hypothetical protein